MSQKGPLLAEGRTAEIYDWGPGRVLKLYREGWPEQTVLYEQRQAKASQNTGYRVPAVGEVVEVEGRHGIIYQRVEGTTMLQEMMKKPWRLYTLGRLQARLHAEMHTHPASGIPLAVDRLTEKIQRAPHLAQEEKEKILTHLAGLPEDDKLLHGDFHPDNIMLTPDGPIIIDWIDANAGHPLADVARSMVIATVGVPPGNPLMSLFVKAFLQSYLPTYFKHSPYSQAELEAWMLPVAAARLEENIPHEVEPLLAFVRKRLNR